jgi:D-alanyl-D-alanine carboxypeptidase
MIIYRILAVIFVGLLSIAGAGAQTVPLPPPLDTTIPRAILMDARTGLVFYEKNADELMAPPARAS